MATDMTSAPDSVSQSSNVEQAAERGAGGVVFDAVGSVLVLRHASGDLVFPKGHVEAGEGELQAAIREVEEEAGVRATHLDGSGTWTTEYVNPRGSRRLITWFALRSDDAPTITEDLFTEAAYITPERALEELSHGTDRRLLEEVLAALGNGPTAPTTARGQA